MTQMILDTNKTKMDKVITHLEEELATIRTGTANANMVDRVEVDYYGAPTPLKQIAGVTIQEGRTLVIKPYDANSLKDIEKACNMADLGIAPQNDGSVIRLTVPALTEETRKELCKKVGKVAEEAKIQVRNIRRDANDEAKKNKELTEDMQDEALEKIQKLTDEYTKKIEEIAKAKEKDVMTV